jgi:prepilin-type processing-associated H-X9-DG protein
MAILKSLVVVAWADGHVAEEEKETIEALLQAFEATPAEAKLIHDYAAEPKFLDDIPLTDMDSDDRRVLLQHAVLLTYIDGEQAAAEQKLLTDLAAKLRIPDAERDDLIGAASERAKKFLNLLLEIRPGLARPGRALPLSDGGLRCRRFPSAAPWG